MFDMKDRATEAEVSLQYTYARLDQKLQEVKKKLEDLRGLNSQLIEKNSNKYYVVSIKKLICRK